MKNSNTNRYSKNVHIDLLLLPIYGIIYACLLHTFFRSILKYFSLLLYIFLLFLQIEKTHHESQSVTVTTNTHTHEQE